ncbi:MAG TPA: four helix bundle protein [Candidatus Marinimicrobia bacterium]|nr:four helix bundle protein [Candidatus Neomarinimicrobiota bacterium]
MADIEKYLNRHKNLNRGYRKLDVWKESINLFAIVKKKLNLTKNISFKTKAQIVDSGLSIPSNISEEYSRRHLKETIQFNSVALASLQKIILK